jgi:hypothetical protein
MTTDPERNAAHPEAAAERELIARLRTLQEEEPPDGLAGRIVARIRLQPPPLWQRVGRGLLRPLTVTFRPLPWAAAVTLLLALLVRLQSGILPGPAAPLDTAATPAVSFTLLAPEARSVQLIGSFNQWRPGIHVMTVDRRAGRWIIQVALAPGRHEYAFLVDGARVVADPLAPFSQADGFGSRNSVIFTNGHDVRRL